MRSILNISSPVVRPKFTTLMRIKSELSVTGSANDSTLIKKIEEASSDVEGALGFRVPRETCIETFWHDDPAEVRCPQSFATGVLDPLFLRRKAVFSITSVVLDDIVMDSAEYRLDTDQDVLIRLDASGYPCAWLFSKSIVVTYAAGYALPGDEAANLPPTIESATVELVQSYWFNRGRDALVKSETIPGVRQVDYWVGAVGDPELLPPGVLSKIALVRRPGIAVA